MILNLHSAAFHTETLSGGGTPAWGTEMGQGEGYRFNFEDSDRFITGLLYKSVPNPQSRVSCPLGKGGNQAKDYEFVIASLFDKVFVNGLRVDDGKFLLLVVKKLEGQNHVGRRTLKYNPRMTLDDVNYNTPCFNLMASAIGVKPYGSWFIHEINIVNQDELHFTAFVLDADGTTSFADSKARTDKLKSIVNSHSRPLSKVDLSKEIAQYDRTDDLKFLMAMRTKPFLLLAGISGTGKSRIVKQMAFDSCPKGALRTDETSPGNYCLVEVKPNWHDSTELLGYESKIGGAHYVLTPFIKFLAKAMLYPEVPFFVCLDEMNLAPVEQYFAEFLSVLESRTKVGNRIVSEPLVKADIFKKYQSLFGQLFFIDDEEKEVYDGAIGTSDPSTHYGKESEIYETFKREGLRIPQNVVVIGTVNMDETTHQFSRKVIDRAMTIEMNLPEGNPFMDFYNNASQLVYRDNPTSASLYLSTEVKASDVVDTLAAADAEKTDRLKSEVARFLGELNTTLDGTPFKVAYRVQNELLLYFYQLWREDNDADWEKLLDLSCDQILMMKVLPRIEGDEELLEKPLERLASFCTAYPEASKKIAEMKSRLDQSHFASFWP